MIWFDKYCEHALYMDNRQIYHKEIWKSKKNDRVRYLTVDPDVIADFTKMPFEDDSFYLVVFDPPHLQQIGDTAWMAQKYGKLPDNDRWKPMLRDGFKECIRVLKPYGTLIFKWSEIQISTRDVIKAIGQEPLFGNRSGKQSKTHWMVFMKIPKEKIENEEKK